MTAAPPPYAPVVYRIYDESDRLIYVGASCRLANRLHNHSNASWWYRLIHRVETEPHHTRGAALAGVLPIPIRRALATANISSAAA